MKDNKIVGNFGEDVACYYLKKNGYEIMYRNFMCRQGEIDIIAKKNDEYIFFEVKTRRNSRCGKPIDSVDIHKERHIWNAAKYYLYINNLMDEKVRFDIIEIYLKTGKIYINHVKGVMF